jgi:hypothetical protein
MFECLEPMLDRMILLSSLTAFDSVRSTVSPLSVAAAVRDAVASTAEPRDRWAVPKIS